MQAPEGATLDSPAFEPCGRCNAVPPLRGLSSCPIDPDLPVWANSFRASGAAGGLLKGLVAQNIGP